MNAHWILQLGKHEGEEEFTNAGFHCSNCYAQPIDINKHYPLYEHYCHKCGAHMIEEPVVGIKEYQYDSNLRWE